MTKVTFPTFLFLTLVFWTQVSFAHWKCSSGGSRFRGMPAPYVYDKPEFMKWINGQAEYHENVLLLKTLEYLGLHSGVYTLLLDDNGNVYAGCSRPPLKPSEIKRSLVAKLDGASLKRIKQMLMDLDLIAGANSHEPNLGQRTVWVFNDGKTFQRHDFTGEFPAKAQEIIHLLESEMLRQYRDMH